MLTSQTSSGSTRASFVMKPSHDMRVASAAVTCSMRALTLWSAAFSGCETAAMRAFSASSCVWFDFAEFEADWYDRPSTAATAIAPAVPPTATACFESPLPMLAWRTGL